jgi:hypothetical protein
MTNNRFVNKTLSELREANCTSILDYEDSPVLTLEEAVAKIIPPISSFMDYVTIAKQECNRGSTLLTSNESAAIYLYTMPIPFYSSLNIILRTKIRHELKSWFGFLKLFITALEKLPSTKTTIWRGVNYDDTLMYVDNDVHIWWSVNSCSINPQKVQSFLGESGTLFVIDAIHAKDISAFSAIPDEQEFVLMPGTRVRRRHDSLNFIDRLFVVQLEEINPQR